MSESLVWNAVLTTAGFTAGLSVIGAGIKSISSIVSSLASGIKTALGAVINIVTSVASTITGVLGSAFKVLTGSFSGLSGIIGSIGSAIGNIFSGLTNIAGSVLRGAFDIIAAGAKVAYEIISAIAKISFTALVAGIAAVTAAMGAGVKVAAEWEKGMTGISKVTGIEKGTKGFNDLSRALKDVWASGAYAKEEVQGVARTLGSMGVTDPQALASATNSILTVSNALDIGAEETATSMAKIMQLTPEFVKSAGGLEQAFLNLGSGINELENKSTIKAQGIITGIVEAWPMGKLAGLDMAETAALTTVGQEVGLIPSEIGTMIRTAVSALNKESTKNEIKGFDLVGQLFGMTRGEAQQWFSDEFPGAISATMDQVDKLGLNEMQQTDMLQNMLGAYGMKWIALKGQLENLRDYQDLWNDSVKSGDSVINEYNRSMDNMIDQAKVLKNMFSSLLSELGEMGIPSIMSVFPGIKEDLQEAINWVRQMKEEGYSLFQILTMGFEKLWDHITTEGPKRFNEFVNKAIEILSDRSIWYNAGKWIAEQIIKGINAIGEMSVDWSRLFGAMKSAAIEALTGVRVAFYEAYGTDIADIYDNFRQSTLDAFQNTTMGAIDMGISIKTAVVDVSNTLIEMGNTALTAFSAAASGAGIFLGALSSVLGALAGIIEGIQGVDGAAAGVGQTAKNILSGQITTPSENKERIQEGGSFGYLAKGGGLDQWVNQNVPYGTYLTGNDAGLTAKVLKLSEMGYSDAAISKVIEEEAAKVHIQSSTYDASKSTGAAKYASGGYGGVAVSKEAPTVSGMPASPTESSEYVAKTRGGLPQPTGKHKGGGGTSTPISTSGFTGAIDPNKMYTTKSGNIIYGSDIGTQDLPYITGLASNQGMSMPPGMGGSTTPTTSTRSPVLEEANIVTEKNTEETKNLSERILGYAASAKTMSDSLSNLSDDLKSKKMSPIEYDPEVDRARMKSGNQGLIDALESNWPKFPRQGMEVLTPEEIAAYEDSIEAAGWETTKNAETISKSSRELANALVDTEKSISEAADKATKAAEDQTGAGAGTGGIGGMYYGGGEYEGMGPAAGGYIGPSSEYRAWAMKTKGFVPKVAMLGSINQMYPDQESYFSAMEGHEISMTLDANNEQAHEKADEIIEKVEEPQTMTITILAEGHQAWSEIDAIISYGNSQSINIPIYTYNAGSSGGGGSSGWMPDTGGYSPPTSGSKYKFPTAGDIFGVPSHQEGLAYVPFDNYMAKLHKGERVLTADENRKISGLISITYAPVISIGANVAKEEIKNMMDEQLYSHSQHIEKLIVNKIKGNR